MASETLVGPTGTGSPMTGSPITTGGGMTAAPTVASRFRRGRCAATPRMTSNTVGNEKIDTSDKTSTSSWSHTDSQAHIPVAPKAMMAVYCVALRSIIFVASVDPISCLKCCELSRGVFRVVPTDFETDCGLVSNHRGSLVPPCDCGKLGRQWSRVSCS